MSTEENKTAAPVKRAVTVTVDLDDVAAQIAAEAEAWKRKADEAGAELAKLRILQSCHEASLREMAEANRKAAEVVSRMHDAEARTGALYADNVELRERAVMAEAERDRLAAKVDELTAKLSKVRTALETAAQVADDAVGALAEVTAEPDPRPRFMVGDLVRFKALDDSNAYDVEYVDPDGWLELYGVSRFVHPSQVEKVSP